MPQPRTGHRYRMLRLLVIAEEAGICHLCGKPGANTVDHLVPVIHGGQDTRENLRAAHGRCNYRRGARPLKPTLRTSRRW